MELKERNMDMDMGYGYGYGKGDVYWSMAIRDRRARRWSGLQPGDTVTSHRAHPITRSPAPRAPPEVLRAFTVGKVTPYLKKKNHVRNTKQQCRLVLLGILLLRSPREDILVDENV